MVNLLLYPNFNSFELINSFLNDIIISFIRDTVYRFVNDGLIYDDTCIRIMRLFGLNKRFYNSLTHLTTRHAFK